MRSAPQGLRAGWADQPDLELVIAGPDQVGLQTKLQRQAEQLGVAARVHWPGLLTGDPKWGALRNCEAFVLPSRQENFGVVVAEALGCGRSVLISDQVNIWPEIEQERVGLVLQTRLRARKRCSRAGARTLSGRA